MTFDIDSGRITIKGDVESEAGIGFFRAEPTSDGIFIEGNVCGVRNALGAPNVFISGSISDFC